MLSTTTTGITTETETFTIMADMVIVTVTVIAIAIVITGGAKISGYKVILASKLGSRVFKLPKLQVSGALTDDRV